MKNKPLTQLILTSCCAIALSACGSTGTAAGTPPSGTPTPPTPSLTPAQINQKQEIGHLAGLLFDTPFINNLGNRVTQSNLVINGKTYTGELNYDATALLAGININDFQQGFSTHTMNGSSTDQQGNTAAVTGNLKVYNQPYSFTTGTYYTQSREFGQTNFATIDDQMVQYGGIATETLPENVAITYKGQAISKDETGTLEYTINYSTANNGYGEGKITGMHTYGGDITLERANLAPDNHIFHDNQKGGSVVQNRHTINGVATFTGTALPSQYTVSVYGPNATEIAGRLTTHKTFTPDPADPSITQNEVIGFAGSKQP